MRLEAGELNEASSVSTGVFPAEVKLAGVLGGWAFSWHRTEQWEEQRDTFQAGCPGGRD